MSILQQSAQLQNQDQEKFKLFLQGFGKKIENQNDQPQQNIQNQKPIEQNQKLTLSEMVQNQAKRMNKSKKVQYINVLSQIKEQVKDDIQSDNVQNQIKSPDNNVKHKSKLIKEKSNDQVSKLEQDSNKQIKSSTSPQITLNDIRNQNNGKSFQDFLNRFKKQQQPVQNSINITNHQTQANTQELLNPKNESTQQTQITFQPQVQQEIQVQQNDFVQDVNNIIHQELTDKIEYVQKLSDQNQTQINDNSDIKVVPISTIQSVSNIYDQTQSVPKNSNDIQTENVESPFIAKQITLDEQIANQQINKFQIIDNNQESIPYDIQSIIQQRLDDNAYQFKQTTSSQDQFDENDDEDSQKLDQRFQSTNVSQIIYNNNQSSQNHQDLTLNDQLQEEKIVEPRFESIIDGSPSNNSVNIQDIVQKSNITVNNQEFKLNDYIQSNNSDIQIIDNTNQTITQYVQNNQTQLENEILNKSNSSEQQIYNGDDNYDYIYKKGIIMLKPKIKQNSPKNDDIVKSITNRQMNNESISQIQQLLHNSLLDQIRFTEVSIQDESDDQDNKELPIQVSQKTPKQILVTRSDGQVEIQTLPHDMEQYDSNIRFVPKLSLYGRVDLRDKRNSDFDDTQYLGRPLHIVKNAHYDESPQIYNKMVDDSVVGVTTAKSPLTMEKAALWAGHPNDVLYDAVVYKNPVTGEAPDPFYEKTENYNNVGIDFVQPATHNTNIMGIQNPYDLLVENIPNPLKNQLFEQTKAATIDINRSPSRIQQELGDIRARIDAEIDALPVMQEENPGRYGLDYNKQIYTQPLYPSIDHDNPGHISMVPK